MTLNDMAEQSAFPNTFREGVRAARETIEHHIPSITDRIEEWAVESDPYAFDDDGDYIGMARDCHCGKFIEGYYEYVDHLTEVLEEAL